MQRFRQPVTAISAGDRAGLCVTQLDAGLVERGLAANPGSVPTFSAAVACADKVRFYAGEGEQVQLWHVLFMGWVHVAACHDVKLHLSWWSVMQLYHPPR